MPFVKEFFAEQNKIWKSKGGVLIKLPADEQDGDDRQGLAPSATICRRTSRS